MDDKARTKKRKRQPWDSSDQGWRTLDVGDEILLGSEEGGFCGLEEFEDSGNASFGPNLLEESDAAEGTSEEVIAKKGKVKGKKKQKKDVNQEENAEELVKIQRKLAEHAAQQKSLESQLSKALKKQKIPKTKSKLKGNDVKVKSKSENETKTKKLSDETSEEQSKEKPLNHAQKKALARKEFKKARREEILKGRREHWKEKRGIKVSKPTQNEKEPPIDKTIENTSDLEEEPELIMQSGNDNQQEEKNRGKIAAGRENTNGSGRGEIDMKAWEGLELDPKILECLAEIGFEEPTPIQRECLPSAVRDRRDIIGAAQTGSGKTLAFGLPILQALLEEHENRIFQDQMENDDIEEKLVPKETPLKALVLTPTRELALQICQHLQAIAKSCSIWVVPIVGGISSAKQERLLRQNPEIVVATPGRLWELMRDGNTHLTNMDDLSFLVLDEADRMVQQGHFEELSNILDYVPSPDKEGQQNPEHVDLEEAQNKSKKRKRRLQTFVFSATLTMPESLRKRLRKGGGGASGSVSLEGLMEKLSFGPKPKIVDLTSQRRLAEKVSEAYLECTEQDRDERLYYLLTQHSGRTLIFANAISTVRRVSAILKLLKIPVVSLHASMQQRQRLKALDKFKEKEDSVMVGTDVAARGLDIQDVACVIHYQIPAAVDIYIHRCGRTARAQNEGISVALVSPKEALRFRALRKAMNQDMPQLFPINPKLLPGARKRVNLAVRLDTLLRKNSKESADKNWEKKAAEEAGIDLSDDVPHIGSENNGDASGIQKELEILLQEPLQPKFSQRFFTGLPSASLLEASMKPLEDDDNKISKGDVLGASNMSGAISKAVRHAKDLTASEHRQEENKGKRGEAKANKHSKAQILEAALQKHMMKRALKKAKKGGKLINGSNLNKFKDSSRLDDGLSALDALKKVERTK